MLFRSTTKYQKLYLNNKLIKEETYYFDNISKEYVLNDMYKFLYEGNLLIKKSYFSYSSFDREFEKDSTFLFKYDKNDNLIEEKTIAIQNRFSIYKKEYAMIKLIRYKYDKNNRLVEIIRFGTNKKGVVDKKKIYYQINYVYDDKNRIIEKIGKGLTWDIGTYKYFYKTLK